MDTEVIKEFVVLADCLSFSEAARRLYTTQSTLSRHISALESEIGYQLFERTSHNVSLTPWGSCFLGEARQIIGLTRSALANLGSLRTDMKRRLKIGYLYDATSGLLPDIDRWIKTHYEDVVPEFTAHEYGPLMQRLLDNEVDIALTMGSSEDTVRACNSFPLYKDQHYLGVARTDRLSRRDYVTLDEVRSLRDFIFPNKYQIPASYEQFSSIFGSWEELNVSMTYQDIRTLLLMIQRGQGVSLVAGHHALREDFDIVLIPIRNFDHCFFVNVMCRKDAPMELVEIFEGLREFLEMKNGRVSEPVEKMLSKSHGMVFRLID